MIEQFKDFPICINCTYFLPEKTGPRQISKTCGLTMVDPVTGDFAERGHKIAAAYRKENNPCGPAGKFFQPGKKKVEPKKRPVVKEEVKESTAKVISVEVPVILNESMHGIDKAKITRDNPILTGQDAYNKGSDDYRKDYTPLPEDDPARAMLLEVEEEAKAPKKRRSRDK